MKADEKPPFFSSAPDAVGRNPADPSADVRAGIRGHVLPNDRRQPRAAPAAGGKIVVISREDGSGTRGAFIELFGIEKKGDDGKKLI